MPYITIDQRSYLDSDIEELLARMPSRQGEMNYIITKLMMKFVEWHGSNYNAYNSAVGILECCKLEFYRRQVSAYEDLCIAKNGDI